MAKTGSNDTNRNKLRESGKLIKSNLLTSREKSFLTIEAYLEGDFRDSFVREMSQVEDQPKKPTGGMVRKKESQNEFYDRIYKGGLNTAAVRLNHKHSTLRTTYNINNNNRNYTRPQVSKNTTTKQGTPSLQGKQPNPNNEVSNIKDSIGNNTALPEPSYGYKPQKNTKTIKDSYKPLMLPTSQPKESEANIKDDDNNGKSPLRNGSNLGPRRTTLLSEKSDDNFQSGNKANMASHKTQRGRNLTRRTSQTSNQWTPGSPTRPPKPGPANGTVSTRNNSPQRLPTGAIIGSAPPHSTSYNFDTHMKAVSKFYKPIARRKTLEQNETGSLVQDIKDRDVDKSIVPETIIRLHEGISEKQFKSQQKAKENKKKKDKQKEDDGSKEEKKKSKDLTDEQVENLLRMADMFDRMKNTVTTHDERIGEYQAILGEVETAVSSLRKTLGTCQLIWKVEGFKSKFKDAAKGDNTVLYSPAFETHPYGYKLALSMCPYGDGAGKGKYISIFFTILQGQWDSLLNWPFNHKVTFTLMDQSEGDDACDIVANFEPNPAKENMPFLGKPTTYRNPSLGLPRFAPLTDVWSGDRFVKGDTVFVKVEVHIKEAIGI